MIGVNSLAWILAQQGNDLDLAAKLAKRAARRLPGRAAAQDTLGWVYYLRGDSRMAIIHLTRACEIEPEHAAYRVRRMARTGLASKPSSRRGRAINS